MVCFLRGLLRFKEVYRITQGCTASLWIKICLFITRNFDKLLTIKEKHFQKCFRLVFC
jgi:hypothetical protein